MKIASLIIKRFGFSCLVICFGLMTSSPTLAASGSLKAYAASKTPSLTSVPVSVDCEFLCSVEIDENFGATNNVKTPNATGTVEGYYNDSSLKLALLNEQTQDNNSWSASFGVAGDIKDYIAHPGDDGDTLTPAFQLSYHYENGSTLDFNLPFQYSTKTPVAGTSKSGSTTYTFAEDQSISPTIGTTINLADRDDTTWLAVKVTPSYAFKEDFSNSTSDSHQLSLRFAFKRSFDSPFKEFFNDKITSNTKPYGIEASDSSKPWDLSFKPGFTESFFTNPGTGGKPSQSVLDLPLDMNIPMLSSHLETWHSDLKGLSLDPTFSVQYNPDPSVGGNRIVWDFLPVKLAFSF